MKLTGADALVEGLFARASLEDIRKTVKVNGSELERNMKRNASFTQGYQTGTTKRSINLALSMGGLEATVAPTTHYSVYLIYGTRFMASQDFLRPSFYSQRNKFIKDLRKLMG